MEGAITACFIGLDAILMDLSRYSAANVWYLKGPPVSRGSWR